MGILYIITTVTFLKPFGESFPYGFVLYSVLVTLLAIISKIVFKKSFDPPYWLVFFIMSMVFSLVALLLWFFAYSGTAYWIEGEEVMGYIFGALFLDLGTFIFFICYLINFLVRLVHHRKQKNSVIPEETKMN